MTPNQGHTADAYAEMLTKRIVAVLTETRDDAALIAQLTADKLHNWRINHAPKEQE